MKKILFIAFCFLFSISSFSQIRKTKTLFQGNSTPVRNFDSIRNSRNVKVEINGKTKFTDYKIISHKGDSSIIDTTLTIRKDFINNFRKKDNFELLPFHNQGQTFNSLGYNFSSPSLMPDIGFSAKQFNFYTIEDINYYHVPTPTTRIMYRSGIEQGQVLDALFTLNFSKRFNVAIEYKGLRSQGLYRRSIASHGNFRTSFYYSSPKEQYSIKGHVAIQDLLNEQNGGLTDISLEAFISDDPNSSNDRGRLDVNLDNTENYLDGKRYYFEHSFRLFSTEPKKEKTKKQLKDSIAKKGLPKKDSISKKNISIPKDSLNSKVNSKKDSISLKDSVTVSNPIVAAKKVPKNFTNLKVGHVFLVDNKFFRFNQSAATTDFFGASNATGAISNKSDFQLISNQAFLDFNSKYILGNFRAKATYSVYEYGYDNLINISAFPNVNVNKLSGNAVSAGADWNAKIGELKLNASANITPGSGRLAGSDFSGEALYKKDSLFAVKGRLTINSKSPNFNTLLFQSNYDNYNWQNNFENVNTRNIGATFESKWGNAALDIANISNYVYFDENGQPQQTSEDINYLKLKVSNEFKVGKFALNNTIMYQNVSSGSSVLRVPEFVTRNTFYYADDWFKGNPLFVNMGVTFKYFTQYKANLYNPLLGEFQLQNNTEIGFPTFDVFFNARVRRTRIYFKLENVTSGFTSKNYFSDPNNPYRDFSIRFGLVWNWFI